MIQFILVLQSSENIHGSALQNVHLTSRIKRFFDEWIVLFLKGLFPISDIYLLLLTQPWIFYCRSRIE